MYIWITKLGDEKINNTQLNEYIVGDYMELLCGWVIIFLIIFV